MSFPSNSTTAPAGASSPSVGDFTSMRLSESSTLFPLSSPEAFMPSGVISPLRFAPAVFLSSIFPSFAASPDALQCDSERAKTAERRSNL